MSMYASHTHMNNNNLRLLSTCKNEFLTIEMKKIIFKKKISLLEIIK